MNPSNFPCIENLTLPNTKIVRPPGTSGLMLRQGKVLILNSGSTTTGQLGQQRHLHHLAKEVSKNGDDELVLSCRTKKGGPGVDGLTVSGCKSSLASTSPLVKTYLEKIKGHDTGEVQANLFWPGAESMMDSLLHALKIKTKATIRIIIEPQVNEPKQMINQNMVMKTHCVTTTTGTLAVTKTKDCVPVETGPVSESELMRDVVGEHFEDDDFVPPNKKAKLLTNLNGVLQASDPKIGYRRTPKRFPDTEEREFLFKKPSIPSPKAKMQSSTSRVGAVQLQSHSHNSSSAPPHLCPQPKQPLRPDVGSSKIRGYDYSASEFEDPDVIKSELTCRECNTKYSTLGESTKCLERHGYKRCCLCFNTYRYTSVQDYLSLDYNDHFESCHRSDGGKVGCPLCSDTFKAVQGAASHMRTHWYPLLRQVVPESEWTYSMRGSSKNLI